MDYFMVVICFIAYFMLCNLIKLDDVMQMAKKNNRTFYEEFWVDNDKTTQALMVVLYPILSIVALVSWIQNKR